MTNLNEINIHLIIKTHFEILLQSLKQNSPDEEFYKRAISQIELYSSNPNDKDDIKSHLGEKIKNEITLLGKAIEFYSNKIKIKTLQVIELIISNELIEDSIKFSVLPDIINIAHFVTILNEPYMDAVILSIIQTISSIKSKEYSLGGLLLYDIVDICFDLHLKSTAEKHEENQKYAKNTLEALINMLILKAKETETVNKSCSNQMIVTKEKWMNKMQKDALSKYMGYYIDVVESNKKPSVQMKANHFNYSNRRLLTFQNSIDKIINEKGIEAGRYGFCINCRNQANFYSNQYAFPFCNMKCLNEMIMLINKIDISLTVSNSNPNAIDDLINLITILSQMVSIDPRYTWEYKEISISQMKYLSMTLIYHILTNYLFNGDNEAFIKSIKESMFPLVIINSALSRDYDSFVLANKIQLLLIESPYRIYLKEEIEVYIERVLLFYLRSENSTMDYKRCVIESLNSLCDRSFAIEMFINFDCNIYSRNLYFELLEVITKMIYGIYDKKSGYNSFEINTMMSPDEMTLRVQCLDLISKLINHLDENIEKEPIDNSIMKQVIKSKPNKGAHIEISLDNDPSAEKDTTIINSTISKHNKDIIRDYELTKRILHIKECFSKAIEKFNFNPLNCAKFLISKEIIVSEAIFNNYRHKYDNQPVTFNESNEDEEQELNQRNNKKNLHQFLNFLLYSKDKNQNCTEELIYHFLTKYNPNNDIITYDHFSAFEMANFIHCNLALINKSQFTSFICSSKQYSLNTLFYFIQLFSFQNHHLTEALRLLLKKLPIIKEPQIICQIVQIFADKYNSDNIYSIKYPEQTFNIALETINLSEEISASTNQAAKTLGDYIEKIKALNKNDHVDLTFLCDVYNKIITNPLTISYLDNKHNLFKEVKSPDDNNSQNVIIDLINKRQFNSKFNHFRFIIERETEDIVNLIQCSWSNYLGIFSQLLNEYTNEQIIQKCIDNILAFARISGILHLYTISDTFINTIINLTSFPDPKDLQQKNLQSLRSLITFILSNGRYISSSWYLILNLLSRIDYYYSEELVLSIERKTADVLSKHVPYNLIESIYSYTIIFPSKQINDFMLALCDVSRKEIESNNNRAFSLHKVVEVSEFNLFRPQNELESLWKIISESFISIISLYKNDQISICTNIIDSLRQIAIKFLNKKGIGNNFQYELFKPFEKLFNKATVKESLLISEMILECLSSITNSSKIIIGAGWISIFELIKIAVKRKESGINNLISTILSPSAEYILNNYYNKDIFVSYVKCFCTLYLEDDTKEYALSNISLLFEMLFLNYKNKKSSLEIIKLFLYGFDELINNDPTVHLQLLFDIISRKADSFFMTVSIWEYCYHTYFKVHLVSIVLFCYVYRLDLWGNLSDTSTNLSYNDYEFKNKPDELHYNVLSYLNKTISNIMHNCPMSKSDFLGQLQLEYKNDLDLIINKLNYFKKIDLARYQALIEGFIENLFELINKTSNDKLLDLQYYVEDIIITLIQLSLFNQTPEILFSIIIKGLLSYSSDISENGWKLIGSNTFLILKSLSNLSESITEPQIKDIVSYSNYFSSFYKYLLINFFQYIEADKANYKLHYVCLNKITASFISIDKTNNKFSQFKLIDSQIALEALYNFAISKTLILEKSADVNVYYDKSVVENLQILNEAFVYYSLETIEDNMLLNVIQINIQSILPKFINIMSKDELQSVFSAMLDILLTTNKAVRESAKFIIELFVDNKMILFSSIGETLKNTSMTEKRKPKQNKRSYREMIGHVPIKDENLKELLDVNPRNKRFKYKSNSIVEEKKKSITPRTRSKTRQTTINKTELNKSFISKPLPSFFFCEVKKSNLPLTIAQSPHLHTKERSTIKKARSLSAIKSSIFKSI